jgi:hypothetical protein
MEPANLERAIPSSFNSVTNPETILGRLMRITVAIYMVLH